MDEESDEAFRSRILEKIRKPITSGNENHYVYWAKQVAGIGNAHCIPCHAGAGTVKVIVLSNEFDIPSNEAMNNVTNYINSQKPIGANVTIVSANPVEISIHAQLRLQAGVNTDSVTNHIKADIKTYLKSISMVSKSYLSYFKIGDILFNTSGVEDVSSFLINDKAESIQINIEEFFKLKEVVVNVVVT